MNPQRNGTADRQTRSAWTDPKWPASGPGLEPWEMQDGETQEQYVKFLLFLGGGPGRTLVRAFIAWRRQCNASGIVEEPDRAPSSWRELCSRHQWVARSRAYDLHIFATSARQISLRYVAIVEELTRWTLAEVKALMTEDQHCKNVRELLRVVNLLGQLVPAEATAYVGAPDPWQRQSEIAELGE
jgi:hypothetical protein